MLCVLCVNKFRLMNVDLLHKKGVVINVILLRGMDSMFVSNVMQ